MAPRRARAASARLTWSVSPAFLTRVGLRQAQPDATGTGRKTNHGVTLSLSMRDAAHCCWRGAGGPYSLLVDVVDPRLPRLAHLVDLVAPAPLREVLHAWRASADGVRVCAFDTTRQRTSRLFMFASSPLCSTATSLVASGEHWPTALERSGALSLRALRRCRIDFHELLGRRGVWVTGCSAEAAD